ncbi:unnamed protein product [Rotaria sp. Silwood1]|nr:unnamed protein product [Rotaria sp. Silwood1]CAF1256370.1 unnamed protein product [Rotaria sp. Silwood1]CAF3522515.1 unnamed protein product [Rotaria sp. Silwood1]CAF4589999.1 unnamed protein product [Rotaria sp. Silwood1]
MEAIHSLVNTMKNRNEQSNPFELMMDAKRKEVQSRRYVPGKASDFYFLCRNGEIDRIRQILDAPDSLSIDALNALEPNGSTPLHAAVFYNQIEIVKMLLERNCSRNTLNRFGNTAYDEAKTSEMQELFHRPDSSNRFHDENTAHSVEIYVTSEHNDSTNANFKFDYVHEFQSDDEISEHAVNQQALAMWLKFYNWFTQKFRKFLERDDYHIDAFDLDKHADFKQFLEHNVSNSSDYQLTMELINKARHSNSIEPLITLYTSNKPNLYDPLNKHLVTSLTDAHIGPHLCDRFVMEFFMRRNELKQRAFTGITYRGITLSTVEFNIYKRAAQSESKSVLSFKSFTSTSKDPLIALRFATQNPPKENEKRVLFTFEVREATSTIFAIEDISCFPREREVLILPGSLFIIDSVQENFNMDITTIRLIHWKVPISFFKKINQTVRCARKSFLS